MGTHSKALNEMAMGFFRSRTLCAAARLGVADALGEDELTVERLAAACEAHPESLYRLLRALASFGVLSETKPRCFRLTPLGRPLRKDVPDSAWAGVVFWADLLADSWSYLTECVRTGENSMRLMERDQVASRWSKDPNARAIFRSVMGTAPAEDYLPIARACDFSRFCTVADLGGGGGGLLFALLKSYSNLRGVLVDRPEAIDTASLRMDQEGLAARCQLRAADLTTEVPAGADVYLMKHVLHGYNDATAMEILRHCREALPAAGRLLVIEYVLPDVVDHADAQLEVRLMSDLNMLAVTAGRERSAAEWNALLSCAGFACQSIIPVAGDNFSIIEAAAL
jgi:hypothetical protein